MGALIQSPGSTLAVTVAPGASGSGSTPIHASGTVRLAGALTVDPGTSPTPGQRFTLIHTTGERPPVGTFTGLAEGATFSTDGGKYQITYVGGSGHDVVLTVLGASPRTTATSTQAHGNDASPPANGATLSRAGTSRRSTVPAAATASAAVLLGLLLAFLWRRRRRSAHPSHPSRRRR
jgi:MYXO-CTERM domain-containing protein